MEKADPASSEDVKRVILPKGIIEGETSPILMTADEIRRAS